MSTVIDIESPGQPSRHGPAIEAHRNGRLKEARALYESALGKDGGDPVIHRCFAHLLIETGENEAAVGALRKAHECGIERNRTADPTTGDEGGRHHGLFLQDVSVVAELAVQLHVGGDAAGAERYAREAILDHPADSLAFELLIRLLAGRNRGDEALDLYENAPGSVRSSFFVSKSMSSVLASSGRFTESIRVRDNGLRIPQDTINRISGHVRLSLTTDYMMEHSEAPLHPGVTRLDLSTDGGESPVFARLEEATVLSGEWYVMDRDGTIFLDMNHGTPTGDPTPYYQDPGNTLRGFPKHMVLPEPVHGRIDRAVLAGGDPNYYHWMADFLPRLMAVGRTPALDDYPILVHENVLDHQRQELASAGIDEDRLLTLEYPGCYPCGELIGPLFPPDPPRPSGLMLSARALAWLRSLAIPGENGGRRIYVSRRDSRRRRIANEDVLIAALEQVGFEPMEMIDFSLKEKTDIFSTAGIVVGCHGAGLTNLAFAPSRCRLIEIIDPGWTSQSFRLLAGHLGQRYDAVACRRYHSERKLPIHGEAFITDGTIDKILRLIGD